MQLEDYFDFQAPNDIRIKGHRIGIETVLYDYIFRERTAEEIQQRWNTLTLEEVYATILYYLRNKEQVTQYIEDWLEWSHQVRKEQERNPPPAILRLRELKKQRQRSQEAA
ncbi:MAG: DUF433 domain-containing protein [Armatimonadetes bacterium]|nr:DUF433 domain-containing protein [Armatimonadota bacterium]